MDRRAITLKGIVQGVGFRPFIYHLVSKHGLAGFVKNQSGGLQMEVEGESASLDAFYQELIEDPPKLARIHDVHWQKITPVGTTQFQILQSDVHSHSHRFIPADIAVCNECLSEMTEPFQRRFFYPFLNCTNCGPRFTIIKFSL
jgi:hydrogenase maturation protein HypF